MRKYGSRNPESVHQIEISVLTNYTDWVAILTFITIYSWHQKSETLRSLKDGSQVSQVRSKISHWKCFQKSLKLRLPMSVGSIFMSQHILYSPFVASIMLTKQLLINAWSAGTALNYIWDPYRASCHNTFCTHPWDAKQVWCIVLYCWIFFWVTYGHLLVSKARIALISMPADSSASSSKAQQAQHCYIFTCQSHVDLISCCHNCMKVFRYQEWSRSLFSFMKDCSHSTIMPFTWPGCFVNENQDDWSAVQDDRQSLLVDDFYADMAALISIMIAMIAVSILWPCMNLRRGKSTLVTLHPLHVANQWQKSFAKIQLPKTLTKSRTAGGCNYDKYDSNYCDSDMSLITTTALHVFAVFPYGSTWFAADTCFEPKNILWDLRAKMPIDTNCKQASCRCSCALFLNSRVNEKRHEQSAMLLKL